MIDTAKYTAHKKPGKFEGETSATEYFWECPQGFVTLCAYGTREAAEWHVKSWLGVVPGLAPNQNGV